MSSYVTREDTETYGALSLGGATLPPSRPVADPYLDRIGETVYGVRRGEEESDKTYRDRLIAVLNGPTPAPYAWAEAFAEAQRNMAEACAQAFAPRRPFRERWEPLLVAIIEAAPREARDGFGRKQGKAWEAFLVELAGLREDVAGGWSEPANATEWARAAWHRAVAKGAR